MKLKSASTTVIILIIGIFLLITSWIFLSPHFKPKKIDLKIASLINSTIPLEDNFSLLSTNEAPFKFQDLKGKWTLMFFGYSTCPDVCPATLSIISDVWKNFGYFQPAQFVFVSLNPKRDDVQNLKKFLGRFDERFIGVTGKTEEINKLSSQLKIFSYKLNNYNEEEMKDDRNIEIIDHSTFLILLDPKVQIKAIISPPLDSKGILQDLNTLTLG